jgi:2-phospho-L-lactate/phosphoenolpyruvate guanylyltransferase
MSMRQIFAIIPVKPLAAGKSRLVGALSDRDRLALNRFLFDRTLATAAEYPGTTRTIVVSRSEELLETARARGMVAVRESAEADLNAALATATESALALDAGGVFILPVDLPLAGPERLRAIIEEQSGPVLVLVPDRHGSGTNLLYQVPVRLRAYRFGPRSIDGHRESAAMAGLRVRICRDAALALDIDARDDLTAWSAMTGMTGGGWRCAARLEDHLPDR